MKKRIFLELLTIFGFDSQAGKAIVAEGYNTLDSLADVTESHLTGMFVDVQKRFKQLLFPSRATFKLRIAHYYAINCRRHELHPRCRELAVKESYSEISRMYLRMAEAKDTSTDVETFPTFNHKITFVMWRKQAENYLNTAKNASGVPLRYVIRDLERVPVITLTFNSLEEKQVATTPLRGSGFTTDNQRVCSLFHTACSSEPGWPFIRGFVKKQDGRAAWKALVEHFMSDGVLSTEKKKAYDSIKSAKYTGETPRYTFKTYVGHLQNNFEILAEYGEAVPEAKKVQDFLGGIHINNTQVAAAVAHVTGSTQYLEDFTAASNYVGTIVENHKGQLKRRNVSAINRNPGKGNGKGGKGKPRVSARSYTHEEWKMLTEEEQKKVRELRALKKKRKIQALEKESEDDDAEVPAGTQMNRQKKKSPTD